MPDRSDTETLRRQLDEAGVRATPRRLALGALMNRGAPRHFSAEALWKEAKGAGLKVSLATLYNTLNLFVDAGVLRKVDLPGAKVVFDTNTSHHHHQYDVRTGIVSDLPEGLVVCQPPGHLPGFEIEGFDIVLRVRSIPEAAPGDDGHVE